MTSAAPQMDLFNKAPPQGPLTLQERFEGWIGDNPGVWVAFERECLEWIALGATRISARDMIAFVRKEVLRTRGDGFCVNNDWARCLADRFIERHKEHAERFVQKGRSA